MKQDWESKELREVCTFFNDGNWIESKDQSETGYRLIQTGNVGIGEFRNKSGKERYISEDTFKRLRCTEIFEGDILVSRLPDPVGRTCLVPLLDQKLITAVDCTIIRLKKNTISDDFFKYYSQSHLYFKSISENITGTTRDRISRKNLGLIPVPIPPLSEQQRIVVILNEAFTSIAKVKANAEQNLKNSKELFESYLQSAFANKGWKEKTLGEVCEVIGGGTPSKSNMKFYNGSISWATVRDMRADIIVDTEHKITPDAVKCSSTNIIPTGNVIIATRVGLGKVCLLAHDTAINQDLKGIVPKNVNELSVDFLFRWLKSIANKIIDEGTGATVQGVKLPFIKSLKITLPSLAIQNSLVLNLDELSYETKRLEAIYQQKLNDLEELKKSILNKAFNGELKTADKHQYEMERS
jgi:type I restriction enzyme S subunit